MLALTAALAGFNGDLYNLSMLGLTKCRNFRLRESEPTIHVILTFMNTNSKSVPRVRKLHHTIWQCHKSDTHWARGLQAPAAFPYQRPVEASAMGGGVWQDNFDGTFTQLDDDYYVPATG